MKSKEIVLAPSEYSVEGEVGRGWFSRLLDGIEGKLAALKKRKAERKAYKQQIKQVENAVYQKEKMVRDVEKAVEKGINRAKPLDEKWKEMSEKLKDIGGDDGTGTKKAKEPLFGNLQENKGLNINDMFANNNTNHKNNGKGGLF